MGVPRATRARVARAAGSHLVHKRIVIAVCRCRRPPTPTPTPAPARGHSSERVQEELFGLRRRFLDGYRGVFRRRSCVLVTVRHALVTVAFFMGTVGSFGTAPAY